MNEEQLNLPHPVEKCDCPICRQVNEMAMLDKLKADTSALRDSLANLYELPVYNLKVPRWFEMSDFFFVVGAVMLGATVHWYDLGVIKPWQLIFGIICAVFCMV